MVVLLGGVGHLDLSRAVGEEDGGGGGGGGGGVVDGGHCCWLV